MEVGVIISKEKDFNKAKKKMEDLLGVNQPGYTYEEELDENNETIGTYEFMKIIQTPDASIPKYLQEDVLGTSNEEEMDDEIDINSFLETITTEDGSVIPRYFREDTQTETIKEPTNEIEDTEEIIDTDTVEDKPKKQRKEYRCLDGHRNRTSMQREKNLFSY